MHHGEIMFVRQNVFVSEITDRMSLKYGTGDVY
jgi:hypothetical protein